jgi:hypothetical protein
MSSVTREPAGNDQLRTILALGFIGRDFAAKQSNKKELATRSSSLD